MVEYKIWIHIEKIDENKDIYEDVEMPISVGSFKGRGALNNAIELANHMSAQHSMYDEPQQM